jgi:hypothetical protein
MVSGVACLLGALWFWTRLGRIRAQMRPIYQQLGIVPVAGLVAEESGEL